VAVGILLKQLNIFVTLYRSLIILKGIKSSSDF